MGVVLFFLCVSGKRHVIKRSVKCPCRNDVITKTAIKLGFNEGGSGLRLYDGSDVKL